MKTDIVPYSQSQSPHVRGVDLLWLSLFVLVGAFLGGILSLWWMAQELLTVGLCSISGGVVAGVSAIIFDRPRAFFVCLTALLWALGFGLLGDLINGPLLFAYVGLLIGFVFGLASAMINACSGCLFGLGIGSAVRRHPSGATVGIAAFPENEPSCSLGHSKLASHSVAYFGNHRGDNKCASQRLLWCIDWHADRHVDPKDG